MKKPLVAIAMGDASGIGPEITVKVLTNQGIWDQCLPLLIADPDAMMDIAKVVDAKIGFRQIEETSEALYVPGTIDLIRPDGVELGQIRFGSVSRDTGRAASLCLEKAFRLAMEGKIDGVVSAPLNKEALHLAGNPYPDELAYLADFTHSKDAYLVGRLDFAWTISVTHHIPFKDIVRHITEASVLGHIQRMQGTLKRAGITNARIAVSALNPHKGEGGLFGREEIDLIVPAIEVARAKGMVVDGPFPGDTIFLTARDRGYQGIVSMYHDQANIARKIMAGTSGATVYMGLPVPCATPAHGTAFGKAGKGTADPHGMKVALECTIMLASKSG